MRRMPKGHAMQAALIATTLALAVFPARESRASTDQPENSRTPVLGVGEDGEVIEEWVPESEYRERFGESLRVVAASSEAGLNTAGSNSRFWPLRTIVIGIGGAIEAGVGPIWKIKVSPRFKLAFTNEKEAALP